MSVDFYKSDISPNSVVMCSADLSIDIESHKSYEEYINIIIIRAERIILLLQSCSRHLNKVNRNGIR